MRYPKLTKLDKLTFHSLAEVELELLVNAVAVPSLCGNRILGHAYIRLACYLFVRVCALVLLLLSWSLLL